MTILCCSAFLIFAFPSGPYFGVNCPNLITDEPPKLEGVSIYLTNYDNLLTWCVSFLLSCSYVDDIFEFRFRLICVKTWSNLSILSKICDITRWLFTFFELVWEVSSSSSSLSPAFSSSLISINSSGFRSFSNSSNSSPVKYSKTLEIFFF